MKNEMHGESTASTDNLANYNNSKILSFYLIYHQE